MLRESETTPNGLYLIKGKFYGNIVKCQKGTYYGNPILKITFAKGATLNYNPADVTYFPYTRTIEGDFRVKGSSEQAKHDELKNSILDKAGIPLLRLTTDGSNEKNKIINALSR